MGNKNTISYSNLTKMISEAIGENYLQQANDSSKRAEYLSNTQMFINYLSDIDSEIDELSKTIGQIIQIRKTDNGVDDDELFENIIDRSVSKAVRGYVNEQNNNGNGISLDMNLIDYLLQTLQDVKQNGGNVSQDNMKNLSGGLTRMQGELGTYNGRTGGFMYQRQYRNEYMTRRVSKLLTNIAKKYVAIYNELKNSALVNEGFRQMVGNMASGFRKGLEGLNRTINGDENRQIQNYSKFIKLLKQTYDSVFNPLVQTIKSGSYTNAQQLIQKLKEENGSLIQLLQGGGGYNQGGLTVS